LACFDFYQYLSLYLTRNSCHVAPFRSTAILQSLRIIRGAGQSLKLLETAPDHEISWDKLRPIRDIIEQIFKRKYYLRLQEQIKANASAQSFVQKLIEDGVYTNERAKSLEDLLPHFWNHDDSTSTISRDEFSAGDLKGIVSDFFSAVELI